MKKNISFYRDLHSAWNCFFFLFFSFLSLMLAFSASTLSQSFLFSSFLSCVLMQACNCFFFCQNVTIITAFSLFFNFYSTKLCFNTWTNLNVMGLTFSSWSNFCSSNRSILLMIARVGGQCWIQNLKPSNNKTNI